MRTVSNRWLNAALFLALIMALYLHFTWKDQELEDYYKSQSQHVAPTELKGSIFAR